MRKATGILGIVLIFTAGSLPGDGRLLTILHTNDLHSHLEGLGPEREYSPGVPDHDTVLGGWARIAAVIERVRAERRNPVLVLDAGDFTMGTLFHMVSREQALELRLMKQMGYDAAALGNHEFDIRPEGLARMISAAEAAGALPTLLLANARFSGASPADDSLAKVFEAGLVEPYTVLTRDGLRIGIFGLMGRAAAEVAPFAAPVRFRPAVEAAREMVSLLKEREKADIVICLSHGGLSSNHARSEDEILAREARGIDVIVSGHTHTRIDAPIPVGSTIIVQAWEYGKQVGVLDLAWEKGKTTLEGWRAVEIDDSVPGDPVIERQIGADKRLVEEAVLRPRGLRYDQVAAETAGDLPMSESETGLGDMVADSIRWYVTARGPDPAALPGKVDFAIESNGVIRDDILRGRRGEVSVADLFRVVPLGIGMDGSMGYPLIVVYLTAGEMKKALEVLTSVYPLKGSDYFLQVSGLRFAYNPHRVLFDRVTAIWTGSEDEGYVPLDYSRRNTKLYRVAANMYNAAFLSLIGSFTHGILDIVPKDRHGAAIRDLSSARVDADPAAPGVQELKEWAGLVEYVRRFPDLNGDGIPDIPASYAAPRGRIVPEPSWSPVSLLSHAGTVTWAALCALCIVLGLAVAAPLLIARGVARRKRRSVRI